MKIFSVETGFYILKFAPFYIRAICLFLEFSLVGGFFASKLVGTIRTTKSEKAARQSGLLLHNNFIAHAQWNKNFSSRELFV